MLKIAEHRSISRAAVSLGLSQPSLSQLLLRLEDEVGAELFNRNARGVTLTEPGRVFQEHARQILGSMDMALEDVRSLDMSASGKVVFAVPPSIARLIGAAIFEELAEHAPKVSLRLVDAFHGTIRGWLEPGKIDLGIMYDLGPLRHLSTRPLVSEELYLAGRAGQFSGAGDDKDADMSDVPLTDLEDLLIIAPGPAHGMRQLLEHEAQRQGFAINIVQESDALSQTLALVKAGRFHAILPYSALAEPHAAGEISVTRIGAGALRRKLCLVRNPAQLVKHASLRVEDLTLQVMQRLIAQGKWNAVLETEL